MTTIVMDFNEKKVYTDSLITHSARHSSVDTLLSYEMSDHKKAYKMYRKDGCSLYYPEAAISGHEDEVWEPLGILVGTGNMGDFKKLAFNMGANIIPSMSIGTEAYLISNKGISFNIVKYKTKVATVNRTRLGFSYRSNEIVWDAEGSYVMSSGYLCYGSGREYAYNGLINGMTPVEAIGYASIHDAATNAKVVEYSLEI